MKFACVLFSRVSTNQNCRPSKRIPEDISVCTGYSPSSLEDLLAILVFKIVYYSRLRKYNTTFDNEGIVHTSHLDGLRIVFRVRSSLCETKFETRPQEVHTKYTCLRIVSKAVINQEKYVKYTRTLSTTYHFFFLFFLPSCSAKSTNGFLSRVRFIRKKDI